MTTQKSPTGITGLDEILMGGLPKGWSILLSGGSGTGKTILCLQYLYNGITKFNENAVFVACEEHDSKIKKAVESFGWDLKKLEDEGKLIFIDATKRWITDLGDATTEFGLGTLVREIGEAVTKIGAKRVVIDPGSTLLMQFEKSIAVRRALHQMVERLEHMGCTSIITVERPEALGLTAWKNVEDFILDGVVILSAREYQGRRIKELEICKMRGDYFISGKHPITITKDGFSVFPMPKHETFNTIKKERVSTGVKGLDDMMNGGMLFCDSTLVAGSTGMGKTMLCMEFIRNGVNKGENGLIISFEESPSILRRNALGIGFDLEKAEKEGKVKMIHESMIDFIPEEFLSKIKKIIDENKPARVVLDSLTSCSPSFCHSSHYRDYLIVLLGLFKSHGVTSMVTSEMPELFGTFKITNSGTSFLVDNIIILRYVEFASEMSKAISVLKMRGSSHEKGILRFEINDKGISVKSKFKDIEGILTGTPNTVSRRIEKFFE